MINESTSSRYRSEEKIASLGTSIKTIMNTREHNVELILNKKLPILWWRASKISKYQVDFYLFWFDKAIIKMYMIFLANNPTFRENRFWFHFSFLKNIWYYMKTDSMLNSNV